MAEQIDWEERARAEANGPCQMHRACDHAMSGPRRPADFAAGAAWQREQLRSEAAVERVAREVYFRLDGCNACDPEGEGACELIDGCADCWGEALATARAILAALLGEEE